MKSVLQDAQQVQDSLKVSARECQASIQEYKDEVLTRDENYFNNIMTTHPEITITEISEPSQVKAQYFPIPRGSINLLLVIIYWHRVEGRCRKRERRKFEALESETKRHSLLLHKSNFHRHEMSSIF